MWKTDGFRPWRQWKAALLVIASGILAANEAGEHWAASSFAAHVRAIADSGGGVLFVFQPADCVATAEIVAAAARTIRSRGVAMKGLIIRAGVTSDTMRTILGAANLRFPHEPIAIGTARRIIELTGTPVAIAITPDGRVVVVKHITGADTGANLATRFLRALGRDGSMS